MMRNGYSESFYSTYDPKKNCTGIILELEILIWLKNFDLAERNQVNLVPVGRNWLETERDTEKEKMNCIFSTPEAGLWEVSVHYKYSGLYKSVPPHALFLLEIF